MKEEHNESGLEIAIIGMAGRFPGAKNLQELWDNLKNGKENITFLSDEELKESGIDTQKINHPNYVKTAGGFLEDKEYFDASFFDYSPREAEVMSPQIRVFHEVAWEVLEDAGYNPYVYQGLIGLFAGASGDFGWPLACELSGKNREIGEYAAQHLFNKDYICARVAFKLNLKGPTLSMQTACSTSLVALHLACQSVLNGECDIALAGAASIVSQGGKGYMYQEGMIFSPDGHCRAFDARARGIVSGSGVCIIALKLLEEAREDGDHIHAVIKATAINNDGLVKASFTAPGIKGQAEVIRTALEVAEVEPGSIGYVEAHGTGTSLGDPIEIEALTLAFNTNMKKFCRIGSIKSNMGHLDTAAGLAGLFKTVLALKYKQIPPTLHFETPNPNIDFENSPFVVNTKLTQWKSDTNPLRAGVSSFGIGGTNAHVILEEAPQGENSPANRPSQLLLLSARTKPALDKATQRLLEHLGKEREINLADAAYTLQVGRKAFPHRKMLVCTDVDEAIDALSTPGSEKVHIFFCKDNQKTVFMFPGQGSQYVNMGRGLYQQEPIFREEMDRCFEILNNHLDFDIKAILYPSLSVSSVSSVAKNRVNCTEVAQPLLFAFEYALAKLLMKWGIEPYAMTGHSVGEYVAAHLAGVFSLEDALKLVALRGKLMQQMPTGSMLSVSISEEELTPLLPREISLAAVNGPSLCVVSGGHEDINKFETQLKKIGCKTRQLHTSHAYHSPMMEPVLEPFEDTVKQIPLNKPQIPYISNVTGQWQSGQEAVNPGYWSRHIRTTVRFAKGLKELLENENTIFVEAGPGKVLSTFLRQHEDKKKQHRVVDLIRHPQENIADQHYLLNKIGQLWLYGKKIAWNEFYPGEKRNRISLPTYPFEGQHYPIDDDLSRLKVEMMGRVSQLTKRPDMADWFYVPSWEQSPLPFAKYEGKPQPACWLVFDDEYGLASRLMEKLDPSAQEVIIVKIGRQFRGEHREFIINPQCGNHYDAMFKELRKNNKIPDKILHFWGVTGGNDRFSPLERLDSYQDLGLYSLLYMAQALGREAITSDIRIEVVTNNIHEIIGDEELCPAKATLLGAVKVIPIEYPNIEIRSIDIDIVNARPGSPEEEQLISQLLEEFNSGSPGKVIAYRRKYRWAQTIKSHRLESPGDRVPRLKEKGVYLIIGGFGGMGFTLAEYLARSVKAKLILVGRSAVPGKPEWKQWLTEHDEQGQVSQKIRKLLEFEKYGAEVLTFSADAAELDQMKEVINQSVQRFGPINGIIYTAGVIDYGGVIQRRTREITENNMACKVKGTLVLDHLLQDNPLDFLFLFSSLGNILYGTKFGQVAYNAANEFLDAFAYYKTSRDDTFTVTVNWTDWLEVGMSVEATKQKHAGNPDEIDYESVIDDAVTPREGVEVFKRILGCRFPRIAISTRDLLIRMEHANRPRDIKSISFDLLEKETPSPGIIFQRPELSTAYVAPRNEAEKKLARIFQGVFGIEKVGIYDDFFELGGDSLKAMGVISKIHKKLHTEIPMAEFFSKPVIESLSQYVIKAKREQFYSLRSAEKKEYYDLSSAQKRLYITQQLDLTNTSYNIPEMFVLEGEPDKTHLEEVFRKLIERHESLRTSFEMMGKELGQKIHEPGAVTFKINYSEARAEDLKTVIADFVRPFNLAQNSLVRVGLVKTGKQRYLLMLDLHHIIADGSSIGILVKDFLALYERRELPVLNIQYKDFAEWQNNQLDSGQLKKQGEYWLNKFKGDIPLLELPTDFPRPPEQRFEGHEIVEQIDETLTGELKTIITETGTTLYMISLAIFIILLSKYTGQNDIIVGSPVLGRRHPDLENLVGMFVNVILMRNTVKTGIAFSQFLEEVKANTLQAFDNQDYPFDHLAAQLNIKREAGRNPLHEVVFALQHREKGGFKIPGLNLKPFEYDNLKVKTDLRLGIDEKNNKIITILTYSTTLFKQKTARDMLHHYKEILKQVVMNKQVKLKDIKISHDLVTLKPDMLRSDESEFNL